MYIDEEFNREVMHLSQRWSGARVTAGCEAVGGPRGRCGAAAGVTRADGLMRPVCGAERRSVRGNRVRPCGSYETHLGSQHVQAVCGRARQCVRLIQ